MEANMDRTGTFSKTLLAAALVAAFVISLAGMVDPLLSVGVAAAAAVFLFLIRKPVYGIVLVILATPFSGSAWLDEQIAGIPGAKITNLLVMAAIGFLVISMKPARLHKLDRTFIYGVIILFTIAVFRSTSYIGLTYNMIWQDEYSFGRYILSHLIRPLLIFAPFILIVCYVRSREDVKKIAVATMLSIVALAFTLLVLYALFTPDKLNFEMVREGFKEMLGMHGNNLADFFIAVYPLLLAYTVSKKNPFFVMGLAVSLGAIGIIYSRSAYLVVLICTFAFFIFSRRGKFVPLILGAGAVGFSFIPQTIIQRAVTGFANNDLNDISAGRINDIWLPLINEFLGQPLKLLIGAGRYAIMGTEAFKNGLTLRVGHAHSMYLDTLLDSGIIGLGFFLIFFFLFLRRFIAAHKIIEDRSLLDILIGIEISVVAFLIRGFSDSFFFPTLTNAFLWINLGLGAAIVYSCQPAGGRKASAPEMEQKAGGIEAAEDLPVQEGEQGTAADGADEFLYTGSVMHYESIKEK